MNNKQKMKIVIIVGATCSGKDTLARKLVNEFGYKMVVSTTSRPMRNGEVEGREYHFVTKEKSKEMLEKDMFIEHREYEVQNGDVWIYGITKDQFDSGKHVAIVDFNGMKSLLEYFKDKDVDIATIYVEACVYTRMLRYASRDKKDDETMYECCRRILSDKDEVEIAKPNCDMVINTDDGYDIKDVENNINTVFKLKLIAKGFNMLFGI